MTVISEIRPSYTFSYKKVSERINYVDIYLPSLPSHKPLQVIVYFHGGGLTVGNRKSWFPRWMYDRAMQAKYAFISADYTLLAPATGHDLLDDIKNLFCYVGKDLNNDLVSHGSDVTIDPLAIVAGGTSAGGLCAYLAALHAVPKPRGVLSMYGQGGDFLSWQYLAVKTEPFFLGREILDPEVFRDFLHPFPPNLKPTSDSPLTYNPRDHPTAPGFPANLRMQLCRMYLQLGVFLDYYTGEYEPGLSTRLRLVLENHDDPETLVDTLRRLIPERHIPLFPQLLIDSSFPPTFLIHGEVDSAVRIKESHNIARLLSIHGVKNTIRIAPGEEHSFDYVVEANDKYSSLFDEVFTFIARVMERSR